MIRTETTPSPSKTEDAPRATLTLEGDAPLPSARGVGDITQAIADAVEKGHAAGTARGVRDITQPFGVYEMPHDMAAAGVVKSDTVEQSAVLASTVQEMVTLLFTQKETIAWAKDRGHYLAAHPEEGVATAMVGPELRMALSTVLDFSKVDERLELRFGEGASAVRNFASRAAFDFVLGHGVLDRPFSMKATDSIFAPDGTLDPKAGASISHEGVALIEASLESMIGLAGQLIKGDLGKDIDMMAERLHELKKEKKALMGKLVEAEGSILGMLTASAEATKKANDALECERNWKIAGAVVAIVVAVAVAIVVTVFSAGVGAPAAIAGACAVVGISIGATAASALAIGMAVAACVSALITIVQAVPTLLVAFAVFMRALGDPEAADNLEQWAEDYETFMKDSGLGQVLDVVKMVCDIYLLVMLGPLAITSAVSAGGSAVSSLMSSLGTIKMVGGLATGATGAIASAHMRDFASLNREVDQLKEQLAEVEFEISTLLHQLKNKAQAEEEVKEDIASRQEMEATIMENLNKAAESLKSLLDSASLV